MPFFDNDNIHTWFQVCFDEHVEAYAEDEQEEKLRFIQNTLADEKALYRQCEEFLSMQCEGLNRCDPLFNAILNSIEWDNGGWLENLREENDYNSVAICKKCNILWMDGGKCEESDCE
jgi:hypothetical protein